MDPKLLDQARETLRLKHYSYQTEQTYIDWIKRFMIFHSKHHPNQWEGGLRNQRPGEPHLHSH